MHRDYTILYLQICCVKLSYVLGQNISLVTFLSKIKISEPYGSVILCSRAYFNLYFIMTYCVEYFFLLPMHEIK